MNSRFWLIKGLLFLALALMSGYSIAHYSHSTWDVIGHVCIALTAVGMLARSGWLFYRHR